MDYKLTKFFKGFGLIKTHTKIETIKHKTLNKTFKVECRDGFWDDYIISENIRSNQYSKLNLKSNDVVLDIGSHIGTFSIVSAVTSKKVICYEASKENFKLLNKNVVHNNLDNVISFNQAVGGGDEKLITFYVNKGRDKKSEYDEHGMIVPKDKTVNTGAHSTIRIAGRTTEVVSCVNINTVLNTHKPNKIKLDCEGAEYNIIKNIEDWTGIDAIAFEYHISILKDRDRKKQKEITEILHKHFKFWRYPNTISKSKCCNISFWN